MATDKTTDSSIEISNIQPRNFVAPLEELIESAVTTQGFRDSQADDLCETLSNIRGMKSQMLEGVKLVSAQAEKDKEFEGANQIITMLSDLVMDMETIERRVVNRLTEATH